MKKIPIILLMFTALFLFLKSNFVYGAGTLIPENTTCKKITTEHVNVLPYNGKDPGITRACIGWAPNFPSTRVEGGQGTYFYFAYKLFPVPMPAYSVNTNDDLGLEQTFTMSEPIAQLGACDPKQSDTKDCKMYQPFLYYPAEWENRFRDEDALSEFKGPYTVGPHEFYHYRYRGRLVPQQVTFHFDVVDMEGQRGNIPLAYGQIVYDIPDTCYLTDMIDIKDDCRLIEFYIPTVNSNTHRKLPEDARAGALPEKRILFHNPGEHTFRVEVDEKQMYRYQVDEGEEWQGKDGVYREGTKTPGEPDEKYVEIHKYAEGVFLKDEHDPATSIGVGNWCFGYTNCSIEKIDVGMTETVHYDQDGYEGTLKEITTKKAHSYTGDPSGFKYYAYRTMLNTGENCYTDNAPGKPVTTHCDADGPGYDYFQHGIFKRPNGTLFFSGWRQHSRNNGLFLGWENGLETTSPNFYGYEWRRYQIVGGIVKKKAGAGTESSKYSKYNIGPVKTHTLETLPHGEIKWVNREDYKNHCYSEEDAFSEFGEWDKTTPKPQFKEEDSPVIVCFHNHSDDFHYWKFKWSPVRKFGGDTKDGLLF